MLRLKGNDVAVAPIFDPPRTSTGLYIPDIAKERCDQGIVKYLGPKVEDIYYGDHVLFSGYDGTLSRIDGEGFLIFIPEEAVVAVLFPPEHISKGIYFRSPPDSREMSFQADEIMQVTGCTMTQAMELLAKGYVRDQYFEGTYEIAVDMIANAITNSPWKDRYRFKDRKASAPRREDIFKGSEY